MQTRVLEFVRIVLYAQEYQPISTNRIAVNSVALITEYSRKIKHLIWGQRDRYIDSLYFFAFPAPQCLRGLRISVIIEKSAVFTTLGQIQLLQSTSTE